MTSCESCGQVLAQGEAFCGNCGRSATSSDRSRGLGGSRPVAANRSGQLDMTPWPATGTATGTLPGSDGEPRPPRAGDRVLTGAAVGQATPNSTYIGQRLLYEKVPEQSFDPITNPRFLFQMARQGLLFGVIWLVGGVVSAVFFAFLAVVGVGATRAFGFWAMLGGASWLALFCLYLVLPVTALLSEWKFLVDDKGAAGQAAFDHVIFAIQRRRTPLDSIRIRRLDLPGGEARDYLEVQRGIFTGFVSSFPQGADLYVGWTFWLRLFPLRWLSLLVTRLWHNLTQRGTDLYITLRYDSAKAMRDAMHSAAREGIDVAVGQIVPQGRGMASDLPVDTTQIPA